MKSDVILFERSTEISEFMCGNIDGAIVCLLYFPEVFRIRAYDNRFHPV